MLYILLQLPVKRHFPYRFQLICLYTKMSRVLTIGFIGRPRNCERRTFLERLWSHMSLDSKVLALYITEGASMYITHTGGHLSEKSVIYILKLFGRLASLIGFCWHRTINIKGGGKEEGFYTQSLYTQGPWLLRMSVVWFSLVGI